MHCKRFCSGLAAFVIVGFAVSVFAAPALAGQWPGYRGGPDRSASTTQELKLPLHLQWTYVPDHPPSPAWPDPVREIHLMAFDRAYDVAAADGLVYFGSSADHKVYALDLHTGRERWAFFTGAPVRFAPSVWQQKVYAASDDGYVYCLSAEDGKLIWRFRGGPSDERILGNGHLISRWPLRNGLLVSDGIVYFTAGIWPLHGVYAFALKADDGAVVWKVERTDGFAPQGYLAANDKFLVAPTGRANVWIFNRSDGGARAGVGHGWAIVRGNQVLSGPRPHSANENLPGRGGSPLRPRPEYMTAWSLAGGRPMNIGGKLVAALSSDTCYAAGGGKIAAHALANFGTTWQVDGGRVFAIASAGKSVIAGGEKSVAVLAAADGKKLWSAPVEGEARGIAVADGRLIVSTDTGRTLCFGPAAHGAPARIRRAPRPVKSDDAGALAKQLLEDSGISAGFCVLVGAGDGRLAAALAQQSKLRVYCAETDAKRAAAARKLLSDAGLYGARVTVHHAPRGSLPYPEYFADLIVVHSKLAAGSGVPAAEVRRVLRPCGGTAYQVWLHGVHPPMEPFVRGKDITETRVSGTLTRVVRGPLPGAADWTHQYANAGKSACSGDDGVRWPLKVLWFGEPGPARMMQRHFRGTAPVCINGRMFILGQHSVMAVDAYNGRELWSRPIPSIQRRVVDILGGNLAADDDSIYIVSGDVCLRLNAATGAPMQGYRLPTRRPSFGLAQEQTFDVGDGGRIVVRSTDAALELELATKDANVTNADPKNRPTAGDSWELFFDFRAAAKRPPLYGPGAFQVVVVPASQESAKPTSTGGPLSPCPRIEVSGTRDKAGSATTVRIAWAEIAKLAGGRPAEFTFGAILNSSDDGRTRRGRSYKFANNASHRLANFQASLVVDPKRGAKEAGGPALPESLPPERLVWGHLAVTNDVLVGAVVEHGDTAQALQFGWDYSSEGHDYTGPRVAQVLNFIGVAPASQHLFALGKKDGRLLWTYDAAASVPHNAVAVWKNRVFLIDRISNVQVAAARRRGEAVNVEPKLVALDLATGKVVWQTDKDLGGFDQVRVAHGVLLACSQGGMTAFDANDGAKLWSAHTGQPMHHCSAYMRAPVITSKWVYDEPFAYDIRTGKKRAADASGKNPAPWVWGNYSGCGTVSASEHALFYRAANPTFLDAAGTTGQHKFLGIRPGCYINMIAAGGLLLMPEASSGCGCPYNFQTTVVLAPDRCPAPAFRPGPLVFGGRSQCEIVQQIEEGEIRYTLDGSDPTKASLKYEGRPIQIERTLTLKARFFHEDGGMSPVSDVTFSRMEPVAWKGLMLEPGLDYHYYEGSWPNLPDFRKVKPVQSGVVANFSPGPARRDDNFGLQFSGYVKIARDGQYTFYTVSDDGSRLFIADKLIVNNDGTHPPVEKAGSIELKAGMYAIRVEFAEVTGGQELRVLYSGPDVRKQEVPQSVLFHPIPAGKGE
ncbi:MAG: PQQ-binding-like beta-propeller repeat protein [Planctomycetota bacterium]